jgi:hypothetical protein
MVRGPPAIAGRHGNGTAASPAVPEEPSNPSRYYGAGGPAVPHPPMHAKKIIYWTATIAFAAFMANDAYSLLTHEPKMMAGIASLGYPAYFPNLLGVAKTLGVLTLIVPGLPRLKEWAYAGFVITLISAIYSHLSSGQSQAVVMPALALVVLAISYSLLPYRRTFGVVTAAAL